MKLGLTRDALLERRKGIGGSDVGKIMAGEWYDIWLDKTGRKEPEDLSRNLAVMMGLATEEFNAHWYGLTEGAQIVCRGELLVSRRWPVMRCTLDGVVQGRAMVWQAKHVNAFSKIEDVVARYTPQVTHEMIVAEMGHAVLSVFVGNDRYEAIEIALDGFYAEALIEREREFWAYVETDKPPPDAPAVTAPIAIEKLRSVDMTGNNAWSDAAARWLANRVAAKAFDQSTKDIKALVEGDVGEARGHGVIARRDRRGLSVQEMK